MKSVEILLSQPQMAVMKSQAPNIFYLSGVGGGKTFLLGLWVYNKAKLKNSLGLVTAPVGDTLTNSTLPGLQEVWHQCGLVEGDHYIIGNRPPRTWNIRAYTHRNSKILTWRWGAYTILDSSDNFNKHRGTELDYVGIDEFRDIKEGAYKVYNGRMRGKATKKSGGIYQILAVTTPSDIPYKVEQYAGKAEMIYGSSFDNISNLPDGYLENLKDVYDELTYRREVLGELVADGGRRAYYVFDEQSIVEQDFVPNLPTVMCWDFNASPKKPMSTQLVQDFGSKRIVTAEFIFKGSNTSRQCEVIRQFFKEKGFSGELTITGDYSGHRNESNATRSDYAIIGEYFENDGKNYALRTRPTLSVRDRVASLNAQIKNMKGERSLFIDKRCVKTIADLYKTSWGEDGIGLDGSDPERTHPSDALSYWAYNFYPIDRKPITVSSR